MKIAPTPLDAWIAARIGLSGALPLNRAALERWQLVQLNGVLRRAREKSPLYRLLLADSLLPLSSLAELAQVPFLTPQRLRDSGLDMLCVPGGQIARIITLHSSGTTGTPKRVHFTTQDLEQTIDFFHHGMSTMVNPGELVAVLMPGDRPATVGELLREGLKRLGAHCEVLGLVSGIEDTARRLKLLAPDCIVGIPTQVLALARHPAGETLRPRGVLLSADYVPSALAHAVEQIWQCPVYAHWGMSETGLGGAVECRARSGMHPREADLLLEIVDPASGQVLPDGQWGEIVVTTLTRRGMPLIRYRTGDEGRMLTAPCPCGSVLKRLDQVRGRLAERVRLGTGRLAMPQLDDALFSLPWLTDSRATLLRDGGAAVLELDLYGQPPGPSSHHDETARQQAATVLAPVLGALWGSLVLGQVRLHPQPHTLTGPLKRRIQVCTPHSTAPTTWDATYATAG